MKKVFLFVLCLAAIFFVQVYPASAQVPPPQPHRPMMPPNAVQPQPPVPPEEFWHDARVRDELRLTDEQVAKLEESLAAVMKKGVSVRTEMEKAHLEMELAFLQKPVDAAKIRQLAGKQADLQKEMMLAQVDHRLRCHEILTEEQRGKLRLLP